MSHYLGVTKRAAAERLAEHAAGGGARITAAFIKAGGTLTITRIWAADNRQTEKRIKAYGKLHQLCPACNARAMKHAPKGLRKGRKICTK